MGKQYQQTSFKNQISQNDFPVKYEGEVNVIFPEIRFIENLSVCQKFFQERSFDKDHPTWINRLSVYCRSSSGKYHDAFTKFSNHFRHEKEIRIFRIYDALKIYLQTVGGNIHDMKVKLFAKETLCGTLKAKFTCYTHDIEIWLP